MREVRARLEREREAAIQRLRDLGIAEEEKTPVVGDIGDVVDVADHAQVSERREMGLVTRERLAERINRLTAALERLERGTYGTCVRCGGPIERARLEAIPEVETCVRCQEEVERSGEAA